MKIYIITARSYPEADLFIIGATEKKSKAEEFIKQFKDDEALGGYELEYEETESEDIACMIWGLNRYHVTGEVGGELTAERTLSLEGAKEDRVAIYYSGAQTPLRASVYVMTGGKKTAICRAKDLIKLYTTPEEHAGWLEPEETPEECAAILSWEESEEKPSKTQ